MGEPAAAQPRVAAVVAAWTANVALVNYAACGHLTKIGKAEDLDRKEVVANYKVIKPLIEHLGPSSMETKKDCTSIHSGLRPSLDDCDEAVEALLFHSRPRGRALPSRHFGSSGDMWGCVDGLAFSLVDI